MLGRAPLAAFASRPRSLSQWHSYQIYYQIGVKIIFKKPIVDNATIAKWQKEIESIERTVSQKAALRDRISQINLDRLLS